MKFNINHYVILKLTPLGVKILKDRHKDLYDKITSGGRYTTIRTPKEYNEQLDKLLSKSDNHYRIQMWSMMETFGLHCGLGMENPFDTVIEIEE